MFFLGELAAFGRTGSGAFHVGGEDWSTGAVAHCVAQVILFINIAVANSVSKEWIAAERI